MRLNDLIQRFKNPSLQIPIVSSISDKYAQLRSTVLTPISRASIILANRPRLGEVIKFPSLPKLNIPSLTDPFNTVMTGFLNLKDKIPKIGFPEMPQLPDVGGWAKEKIDDAKDFLGGIVDKTAGAAEDWKAAQKRKKMIRYFIIAVILFIIGVFAFKRKR